DQAQAGWIDEETGEVRFLDLALFDVGYARSSMDEPVWALVAETAGKTYQASKGFGSAPGQSRYNQPRKGGRGKRLFNHGFALYQVKRRAWLYHVDADYWKLFVHQGLTTPPGRPGALTLFGSDPLEHRNLARHLVAEKWESRHTPGRGTVWTWRQVRKANHWFDAAALASAAGGILGIKTVGRDPASAVRDRKSRAAPAAAAAPAAPAAAPSPAAAPAPAARDPDTNSPSTGLGGRRISRIARFG
ncbi:MAG TPA: hypothetical protein VMY69_04905, partial [Phycisphaerae bacterium]|nr:hypothetical protein [Phycisphaerae bacterium]